MIFFFVCLVFQDRISLCSSGRPETYSVEQTSLKLKKRDLPVFAFQRCVPASLVKTVIF